MDANGIDPRSQGPTAANGGGAPAGTQAAHREPRPPGGAEVELPSPGAGL